VITPNPKTSGGARWNFLAAWAYAKQNNGSDASAQDFVKRLFANVPVLDSGARGSTTTFVERGIGDVLLAWENEAFLAQKELGEGKFEVVIPSISILAEPQVAVLDGNAKRHGTEKVAEAYLKYLYTPEAQEIIAQNYYRPIDLAVQAKHASEFPKIKLVTIDGAFGGWQTAQKRFFADGGVFDAIFAAAKK
jgi:sulfate transport system substrate-binding protein